MKKGRIAIVFLLVVIILAGCGDPSNNQANNIENSNGDNLLPLSGRHFKIGVNAECAPYESIDEKGNFVGFDIDFAEALSKKLGFTYEWKDMEFFGLIGEVQSKKVDMVISCLSGTDERKEKVDFSKGYNYSIMCIISKPGSGIKTVEDLAGKKVGAATGSNFEALIKAIPRTQLVSFDVTVPAVTIVGTSELDALIELSTFGEHYGIPAGLESHVISKDVAEELAGDRPLSIAFPKGSDLVSIFDQAITELEEEGILDEIAEKWLGEDYVNKLPEFYGN